MDHPYNHPNHHNRRDEDEYPPPPNIYPPINPHYNNNAPPPPHIRPGSYYNQPPPFDTHHHHNNAPPPPHIRPGSDPYYNQPLPFNNNNAPQPPNIRPGSDSYYNQPQVHHTSHGGGDPFSTYPPPLNTNYYNPPPSHEFHHSPTEVYPPVPHRNDPYSSGSNVHHVSHENKPHGPSSIHNPTHQVSDYLSRKPSVRLYSKAETNYSLTIRDGKVILARADPSDPFQHWVKDEKYSTKVKDEQGFPSFALVNKATGQAMKHSVGATHPVQLIPYVPDKLDESILWTLSVDLGDGYRTIRMINNIRLNVDAFNGDKNHGGVRDGTTIVLWEWLKGENQRWKIVPY